MTYVLSNVNTNICESRSQQQSTTNPLSLGEVGLETDQKDRRPEQPQAKCNLVAFLRAHVQFQKHHHSDHIQRTNPGKLTMKNQENQKMKRLGYDQQRRKASTKRFYLIRAKKQTF